MASYYHNKGVVLGDKTDFRRHGNLSALSSISNDDNSKKDKPESARHYVIIFFSAWAGRERQFTFIAA
eukprot:7228610-Ditylum_brightwellii.AAC.1